MKKIILITITLLTILVIVVTAGCITDNQTTSTQQGAQHIEIWAWDTAVTAAEEAANEYAKVNPNVVVDVVDMAQDDVVTKLNIGLIEGPESKSLPDIVFVEDYNLFGYLLYYPNSFVDLTDSISPDNFAKFKLNSMMYNDRLYGVPYDSGVSGLFYREDVITAAGLNDADMQDLTWDKFIEIGKIVKEKTGYSMLPIIVEGNMEGRIIIQSCGEWYVEDDGETLNILNNKGLKAALETISSMYDSDIVYDAANWDDMVYSIYNDKVCCVVGACWWSPIMKEEKSQSGKWRLAKIPKVSSLEEGTSYSNLGGASWCVLNNGNKDISIDFLKNTFGSDVELINTLADKIDLITTLTAAKDAPNYNKSDEYFGGMSINKLFVEWSEHIPAVNYGYLSYEIDAIVGQKVRSVINGEPVSKAIIEINEEAEKLTD